MDPEDLKCRITYKLQAIGAPIRIPTACWLFVDLFGVLDSDVRFALAALDSEGKFIGIDNGGWIKCLLTSQQQSPHGS